MSQWAAGADTVDVVSSSAERGGSWLLAIDRHQTRVLVEWSRTLRAEMEVVRAESRALIERGRERRLTSTYAGLRRIVGGSDEPIDIVDRLLQSASLCTDCVVLESGLPRDDVVVAMKVLLRTRAVQGGIGACASCGRTGALRSDGRSAAAD